MEAIGEFFFWLNGAMIIGAGLMALFEKDDDAAGW